MADRSQNSSQLSKYSETMDKKKQKALMIKERELKNASNARLKTMLVQKMLQKYGTRQEKSKLNRDIESLIGEYVSNTKEVTKTQIQEIEERVRALAMGPGERPAQQSQTVSAEQGADALRRAFGSSVNPPPTGQAQFSSSGNINMGSYPGSRGSRNQSRPTTDAVNSRGSQKTLLDDDWTLLDAYAIVQTEEQMREEYNKLRQKKKQFKAELDKHLQIKNVELQTQKEREAEFLRKQMEEASAWEQEQARVQQEKEVKNRYLKELRQAQIEEREKQRTLERDQKMSRELRELEIAQKQLVLQQEAAKKAKDLTKVQLQQMWEESHKDREIQDERKKREAEEDMRLMEAYKLKLEREEAMRQSAFAKRMEGHQKNGMKWAEGGVDRLRHEMDRQMEQRLMIEQERKEQEDRAKMEAEANKRRLDKEKCLTDNRQLMEEKRRQKEMEFQQEKVFAKHFVEDTAAWKREQLETLQKRKHEQQEHKEHLMKQMSAKQEAAQHMSSAEKVMNQDLLNKLRTDPDLIQKVQEKLPSSASATYKRTTNNIFNVGNDS